MNRNRLQRNLPALLAMVCMISQTPIQVSADPLIQSINSRTKNQQQESRLQHRIEKLDDETKTMLAEYQKLSRELELLTIYNNQLQRIITSQEEEKISIAQQMKNLEQTQQEVVPLMLRMVEWMETFVQLDHPFLPQERQLRVSQLRSLMDRSDISIGEKYRRVLEAYQVEMEYGRTIEAYRDELQTDNNTRTVDFLRVGRVGLYYQTLDRLEIGQWNSKNESWEVLPSHYGMAIRNGLRIARNQAAPDLLRLPIPAATNLNTSMQAANKTRTAP
ncbi:MAG: DUF3450 domain-containing protein [Gammaproteobacteria bacterium]|nr:DUF3450 domain-containing protein [Gammaproteobacteria bacterium]